MSSEYAPPTCTIRTEPLGGERGGVRDALLLLVILLACLPPLLSGLGELDTTHTMENLAVFSSQETWLRLHGWHDVEAEPGAWVMPSRNREPRLRKPPGVVWANLLAWTGLEPGDPDATPDALLYRARLVSVAMGVLLIAGVYGIGRGLGDRTTAALAALVAGTMILTQKQARYASYDIYIAAWLAVAMGVAPLRGLLGDAARSARSDAVRWLAAGLAMGAAWMCKGPLAAGVFVLALLGVVVAGRSARGVRRLGVGLLIALPMACVVALPWYVWAELNYDLLGAMFREASHVQERSSPPWYYAGLLGLVFPWTVWLIGGLFLPWLRLGGMRRRQALAGWFWFALVLVAFSLASAKQQRYILPIVPAAAVLIAQLWRWHVELVRAGEDDPGGGALRWPHAVVLVGGALAFAPFVLLQEQLVTWGVFERREVGAMHAAGAVAVSLGMLVCGGLTAWWTLGKRKKPIAAAAATAAWMIVFSTAWWAVYAHAPDAVHPVREPALKVAELTADAPVRSFITEDLDEGINEELLFYSQRIMPEVDAAGLEPFTASLRQTGRLGYVVAPVGEPRDAMLRELGYTPVKTFQEDYDRKATLWAWGMRVE
ncbi:MAG: ArnT family glycosyltransferase [Phycisphaeraceae bacterium]